MVDYQTVSIVLTGIGMIIALTYYGLQIRNQNRTRQTQLFMNLYTQMRSKEFVGDTRELSSWQWSDFEDFRAKYGSRTNKEANTLFYSTANFFDGVGVLVEHGELDPKLVEELMSSWVIWFWEKFGEVIKEYRRVSYPQYLEKVEFLYDKIKPLTAEEHPQFRA
jgi:hypothetical protein